MSETARMVPLNAVLALFQDGDEHGWDVEFDRLWSEQADYMNHLTATIQETGIQTPILLGSDGRVWDGHHRLAVAQRLGIEEIPVEFASSSQEVPTGKFLASEPDHETVCGCGARGNGACVRPLPEEEAVLLVVAKAIKNVGVDDWTRLAAAVSSAVLSLFTEGDKE